MTRPRVVKHGAPAGGTVLQTRQRKKENARKIYVRLGRKNSYMKKIVGYTAREPEEAEKVKSVCAGRAPIFATGADSRANTQHA